ncbi:MAG: DUF4390 domain-containing protein [Gemmatimonadetes bacterium]|nr:DUF4390 domain-containing protein [Gemmatimonadota bacterium]
MRRPRFIAIALLALSFPAGGASADDARDPAVEVAKRGERLVARFGFALVPSETTWQSILGGIPAAIDITASVRGERRGRIAVREERYRIAYDLWEERFDVAWSDDRSRSFETAQDLRHFFARIALWDLLPLRDLKPAVPYRIEVAMIEHRIAPEKDEEWGRRIAGDPVTQNRDREQTSEVSFSLQSLIRFFYGDVAKEGRPRVVTTTFTKEELTVVTDSP